MRRHIVLGGAGFIGSHLCDALLAVGDAVVCFDNMSTGRRRNVAAAETFALTERPINPHDPPHFMRRRFEVVEGDVRDPARLGWNGAAWLHGPFDVVWNLACPASPPAYQADPIGTMMTCVVGTKNALDLARQCGAILVQASTSEVYGDPLEHPQREDYLGNVSSIGPRACYDEGKRAAETLCFDYRRVHGLDVRVARIFNTYGERMRRDDGRVVTNFITRALAREKLVIHGDGHSTRSFCHVGDMVCGLVVLGSSNLTPSVFNSPFNLGNPVEVSLNTLASHILGLIWGLETGARYEEHVTYVGAPVDDPRRRRPDITRARDVLGWEPTVGLVTGLRRTIANLRVEAAQKEETR
jgi:UDP-glucuronate decarboxylase